MGAAFATPAELASVLQVESVDNSTAGLLLQLAADVVRDECNQTLDLVTTTDVFDGPRKNMSWRVSGDGDATLFLPERPVLDIPAVIEIQQNIGPVDLVPDVDYTWTVAGDLIRIINGDDDNMKPWTRKRRGITVTYQHGWAVGTPEYQKAKTVSLQVAARGYVNPEGFQKKDFGGYSLQFKGNSAPVMGFLELTPHEKLMLSSLHGNSLTC